MNFYPVYYPTNNWDRNNYCRTSDLGFCPLMFPNRKMQKPEYNHYQQGYGGYNSHFHQFHNHYHHSRHRHQNHHLNHRGGTRNVIPVWVFQPRVNVQNQNGLWRFVYVWQMFSSFKNFLSLSFNLYFNF